MYCLPVDQGHCIQYIQRILFYAAKLLELPYFSCHFQKTTRQGITTDKSVLPAWMARGQKVLYSIQQGMEILEFIIEKSNRLFKLTI